MDGYVGIGFLGDAVDGIIYGVTYASAYDVKGNLKH